jgi:hypothetical protein
MSQKFLRRKAASKYLDEQWGLPRAPTTLAKLAVIGGGPIFRKAGRIPLYAPEDLDQYAEDQIGKPMRSTCDLTETEYQEAKLRSAEPKPGRGRP